MTVFKGYLQQINGNKGIALIYLGIFLAITLLIPSSMSSDIQADKFSAVSINIAVVDKDNSDMSRGLTDYLKQGNSVIVSDEIKDSYLDKLYYQYLDYIVVIPEGYETDVMEGKAELDVTKGNSISKGIYGDLNVSNYTNELYVLSKAGFTAAEAVKEAGKISEIEPDVEIVNNIGNDGETPAYYSLMIYLPFLYLGVLCFTIGSVMLEFREKDIKKRMKCSSVSPVKQGIGALMAFAVLAAALYIIVLVIMIIFYGKELDGSSNMLMNFLNSTAMLICAVSIAYLLGTVVNSRNAMSGAANMVSLGMSFIGGVFVPLSVMNSFTLKIARFIPTYWYEVNLGIITDNQNLMRDGGEKLSLVYTGIGIQLAMSILVVTAALVINHIHAHAE